MQGKAVPTRTRSRPGYGYPGVVYPGVVHLGIARLGVARLGVVRLGVVRLGAGCLRIGYPENHWPGIAELDSHQPDFLRQPYSFPT